MKRVWWVAMWMALAAGCPAVDEAFDRSTVTLRFAPDEVAFGGVVFGQTRTLDVQVDNEGGYATRIDAAAIAGPTGPAVVAVDVPEADLPNAGRGRLRLRLTAGQDVGLFTAAVVLTVDGTEHTLPVSAQVVPPPSCDDNNPCTLDTLADGACQHTVLPDGADCDDDNACTLDDVCSAGQCMGAPLTCDDGVDCTVDRCDPAVGCVAEPDPRRCDDGDPCTADVCAVITGCSSSPEPEGAVCAQDGCHTVGFCTAGACHEIPTPDGFACDDGDACTGGDQCLAGVCTPGEAAGEGGGAPRLVTEGAFYVDLCAGPFSDANGGGCVTPGVALAPERVLAVRSHQGVNEVIWRTPFTDENGLGCAAGSLFSMVPRAEPDTPPDDGAVFPGTPYCAAGVFWTRLGADGLSDSQQLTAVRGEPAAAFGRVGQGGELDFAVAAVNDDPRQVTVESFSAGAVTRAIGTHSLPFVAEENRPHELSMDIAEDRVFVATLGNPMQSIDIDCPSACEMDGPCCAPTTGHVVSHLPFGDFDPDVRMVRFDTDPVALGCVGPVDISQADQVQLKVYDHQMVVVHRAPAPCSTLGEMLLHRFALDVDDPATFAFTQPVYGFPEAPFAVAVAAGPSAGTSLWAGADAPCAAGVHDGPCAYAVGMNTGWDTNIAINESGIRPQQLLAAGSVDDPVVVVRRSVQTSIERGGFSAPLLWPTGERFWLENLPLATDGQRALAGLTGENFGGLVPPSPRVAVQPLGCSQPAPATCTDDDECGMGAFCEHPVCLDVDCVGPGCPPCESTCSSWARACDAVYLVGCEEDPGSQAPPEGTCPGHTAWADQGCGSWTCVDPQTCEPVNIDLVEPEPQG